MGIVQIFVSMLFCAFFLLTCTPKSAITLADSPDEIGTQIADTLAVWVAGTKSILISTNSPTLTPLTST